MTEIKPIKSNEDYENALVEMEALWGGKLGTPEGDRLDVLATLIDVYEAQNFPMDTPDSVEAIQFRMEQKGITRKDLEPILGSRMRVSEVLGRRRGLSITMIRKLHATLGIPAEILIRPSVIPAAKSTRKKVGVPVRSGNRSGSKRRGSYATI